MNGKDKNRKLHHRFISVVIRNLQHDHLTRSYLAVSSIHAHRFRFFFSVLWTPMFPANACKLKNRFWHVWGSVEDEHWSKLCRLQEVLATFATLVLIKILSPQECSKSMKLPFTSSDSDQEWVVLVLDSVAASWGRGLFPIDALARPRQAIVTCTSTDLHVLSTFSGMSHVSMSSCTHVNVYTQGNCLRLLTC